MSSPEIAKGGVWFDTQTRKVVRTEPSEAIQIVPVGGEVTPDAQESIDAYEAIAAPAEPVVGGDTSKVVKSPVVRSTRKV